MKPTAKNTLHELEKRDKYVFHGSGFLIQRLEPRQAHMYIDGEQIPDGEPAVFASQFSDYAIFMALINKVNFPHGCRSSSEFHDGHLTFRATAKTLAQLKSTAQGYVYVFNKADFVQKKESEWVSHKTLKPVSTVLVHRSDFAPAIETIIE